MRESPDERERYLQSLFAQPETPSEIKSKQRAAEWKKEGISIGQYEAHLISFFIRQYSCLKFVEFGALSGYSGLKILSALPKEGHLWTFELNPEYASFASEIFDEAGFAGRYTMSVGRAEELASTIEGAGPFDGVFIDANKSSYPWYLEWAYRNLKVGGLILADNVLLRGVIPEEFVEVGESEKSMELLPNKENLLTSPPKNTPKLIQQLRLFNQKITESHRFESIILPTKEGLALAIKK